MKLIIAIIHLVLLCAIQRLAVGSFTFTGAVVSAPEGAAITRFESTLIMPADSSDKTLTDGLQSFWPGLMPSSAGGILQNLVTNNYGSSQGDWFLVPYYCCSPSSALHSDVQVYPGQAITNLFTLDVPQGVYLDTWIIENGKVAGYNSTSGSIFFNPHTFPITDLTPYSTATFYIELADQGTWNFGKFSFQNIIITAWTTETAWCQVECTGNLNCNVYPEPAWFQRGDGFTTCYIANVDFLGSK